MLNTYTSRLNNQLEWGNTETEIEGRNNDSVPGIKANLKDTEYWKLEIRFDLPRYTSVCIHPCRLVDSMVVSGRSYSEGLWRPVWWVEHL